MDYTLDKYEISDMVKLDVLVNQQAVDALSVIIHRDDSQPKGQKLVSKMKDIIPRQQFPVPIQAAIGSKIISRANVKAIRKDVLSKCYGGDITPQEAFMTILSLDDD